MRQNWLKQLSLVVMGCALFIPLTTHAATFNIVVEGSGARPYAPIEMLSGGKQSHVAKVMPNGTFSFPILSFNPEKSLNLAFSLPVNDARNTPLSTNIMTLSYNPFKGTADVKGVVSPSSMIIGNINDEDSYTGIANAKGRFSMNVATSRGLNDQSSRLVLSVVNVRSSCCPRTYVPSAAPLVLKIKTVETKPQKLSSLKIRSDEIITQSIIADKSFAVSVPQQKIDGSWLATIDLWKGNIESFIIGRAGLVGNVLEGQSNINSIQSLQKKSATAILNGQSSEQVCRMATLSQSLAKSDFSGMAHQKAIAQILQDRDAGRVGSLYYNGGGINIDDGLGARITLFRKNYCDKKDENTSLDKFCDVDVDRELNRDVDITRVLDTPLTLDVNFVGNSTIDNDKDEAPLLALAENLFPSLPITNGEAAGSSQENYMKLRSLMAARNVARNSFASYVAEKAKGDNVTVTPFAMNVMKTMMVDPTEAEKFLGRNPSYFAQMEVLTKKLYQMPDFVTALSTGAANVDRVRIAMKAVDLQQGADFLESMYRREMMLATYLEQRIQNSAATSNISDRQGQ
jgi:hypothetical protein